MLMNRLNTSGCGSGSGYAPSVFVEKRIDMEGP